jgi:hypothetical protein
MNLPDIVVVLDTREPDPHPWVRWWPAGTRIVREGLETGDLTVRGLEEVAVVERKTLTDLAGCLGGERDRFERELARSRHIAGFAVVVEGSWEAFLTECHVRRNFGTESVIGTIAAWSRRYCPFMFCGTTELAARFAWRFLTGPLRESEQTLSKARGAAGRAARAVAKAEPEAEEGEVMFGEDAPF